MNQTQKPSMLNYILPLIMIALGLRHYVKHGMDALVIIPIVLGVFSLYLALFDHALLQRLLVLITKLWYPIGQGITIVLLTVTFYVVFAPVGLLLRLLNKDILNKKFKIDRPSYWVDRAIKEPSDYTQQF